MTINLALEINTLFVMLTLFDRILKTLNSGAMMNGVFLDFNKHLTESIMKFWYINCMLMELGAK